MHDIRTIIDRASSWSHCPRCMCVGKLVYLLMKADRSNSMRISKVVLLRQYDRSSIDSHLDDIMTRRLETDSYFSWFVCSFWQQISPVESQERSKIGLPKEL